MERFKDPIQDIAPPDKFSEQTKDTERYCCAKCGFRTDIGLFCSKCGRFFCCKCEISSVDECCICEGATCYFCDPSLIGQSFAIRRKCENCKEKR